MGPRLAGCCVAVEDGGAAVCVDGDGRVGYLRAAAPPAARDAFEAADPIDKVENRCRGRQWQSEVLGKEQ